MRKRNEHESNKKKTNNDDGAEEEEEEEKQEKTHTSVVHFVAQFEPPDGLPFCLHVLDLRGDGSRRPRVSTLLRARGHHIKRDAEDDLGTAAVCHGVKLVPVAGVEADLLISVCVGVAT